jgi:hypothetical protein
MTLTSDTATVAPGAATTITLTLSADVTQLVAGLDVGADSGTFTAGPDTAVVAGEITHATPAVFSGELSWQFTWEAPAAEGTYTLSAAALAGDGDGTEAGDASAATTLVLTVDDGCADDDGDGWEDCDGDCDDADPAISPGETETCDDVDQDCDGLVDDDATDALLWYEDADGDGYGVATSRTYACELPAGHAAVDGDCDDTDRAFNPGASEPDCTDPSDYNCDGHTGYDDNDGDGWGACQDCNDGASAVHPGAAETCNTVDDDCDGDTDEDDATDATTWYADADGDGHGDPDDATVDCEEPRDHVSNADDCDDTHADAYPGAEEVWYDGVDQDCDGRDDDRDSDGYGIATDCDDDDPDVYDGAPDDTWYDGVGTNCDGRSDYDADGDGHDSASYAGDDCDDADAATYPGAPDDPYDGTSHDCDDADEFDADGDGHASVAFGGDDCDDASSAIHPDAEEIWYDGVDQDCDGVDNDQDGDGVPFELDCDDTDPDVGDCYEPGGDTGVTAAPTARDSGGDAAPDGCGCAGTTGAKGALFFGLCAVALRRRRR